MTAVNAEPQNMTALDRANRIRFARTALRRELEQLPQVEGRVRVAKVIADPTDPFTGMRVFELLHFIRRVGRKVALKWIRRLGISEMKTVGSLTERQRVELCGILLTCCHDRPIRECRECEAARRRVA